MTSTVDLQSQGQTDHFMTSFIVGCIYDIRRLDLHVDFIVFDIYCEPLLIMSCIRDTGLFLLSR